MGREWIVHQRDDGTVEAVMPFGPVRLLIVGEPEPVSKACELLAAGLELLFTEAGLL